MGGNVLVKDVEGRYQKAGKPDFRKINRSEFTKHIVDALKKLDDMHNKMFGEPIWPANSRDSLLSTGHAFNGSSEHLFNKKLSDEDFVAYKPSVGDIDLTVPHEKLRNIFDLLSKIQGRSITPNVTYIGQNKEEQGTGHQINSLFSYKSKRLDSPINVQIDFEGVEYRKSGEPDEFSKFGHSSSWEDIKVGIKGVFHKYVLRGLAKAASTQSDAVILTPASPLEPPEKIKVAKRTSPLSLLSFSVDRGLRSNAVQQFLPDGSPVIVNGMRAFKELPTSASTYTRTRKEIFTLIFGEEPTGNELKLLDSFVGILQLMNDHLDDPQIESVFLDFVNDKLFGQGQALDAYNPEVDRSAKMGAVSLFMQKFPFLESHQGLLEKLQSDYYKKYKVRVAETFRRRGGTINA